MDLGGKGCTSLHLLLALLLVLHVPDGELESHDLLPGVAAVADVGLAEHHPLHASLLRALQREGEGRCSCTQYSIAKVMRETTMRC
jgi:hypothetical protein